MIEFSTNLFLIIAIFLFKKHAKIKKISCHYFKKNSGFFMMILLIALQIIMY